MWTRTLVVREAPRLIDAPHVTKDTLNRSIHAEGSKTLCLDQVVRWTAHVQAGGSGQCQCRARTAFDRLQPDPAG